jgi:hypothetical protein
MKAGLFADRDGETYPIVENSVFKRPVVPVVGISPPRQ